MASSSGRRVEAPSVAFLTSAKSKLELVHDRVVCALAYLQQLVEALDEAPNKGENVNLLALAMQQLVEAEQASRTTPTTTTIEKKERACLSNLPSVCVINLLQYLDMLSLAEACSSSKALHVDGTLVARCVWKHLVAANLTSPFITLPVVAGQRTDDNALCAVCGKDAPLKCSKCKTVCYCSRVCQEAHWKKHDHKRACKQLQTRGGHAGKKSFAIAAHDVFMRDRHEVLLMGGLLGKRSYVESNEVTKMVIEQNKRGQDGKVSMSIRFEASTPMLEGRCMHSAIYHQGEVVSISPDTTERLDTLTQTRTLLNEESPDDLRVRAVAVYRDKILLIGGKREIDGEWTHSDIVYELVEQAGGGGLQQAAKGKWLRQKARLNNARCSPAAIAFEGKLFVCGGIPSSGQYRSHNVEVYDPEVGAWRVDEEEMTTGRASFSLFLYENEIYAIGGDEYASTIEKRNKTTKQWQFVSSSGQCRELCHAVLMGSKVFLFGGHDNDAVKSFDFFDLVSKTWASKDVGGAYFDEAKRQLPHRFRLFKAILITPAATAKAKTWTDLTVLEEI